MTAKKVIDFKKGSNWSDGMTLIMQVGLTMVLSIGVFLTAGYYLDKWLNTKGIFTTIFILLGIAGGGYTAYRQIMEILEPDEDGKGGQ